MVLKMGRSELRTCEYCRKYKLEHEMWSPRVCFDCKTIADQIVFEYETKKAKECRCEL